MMRNDTSFVPRGAALAMVIVAVSSAVGGTAAASGSPSTEAEQLAQAAETTLSEDEMSFVLEFSVDTAELQQPGRLAGEADFASGRGTLSASTQGVETRSVFDADTFWLTSDDESFSALVPEGKRWVRGSLSELGDDAAVTRLEPLSLLYLLNGADSVVAEDRADSTRYAFDIDVSAAVESAPPDRRDEVASLIEAPDDQVKVTGTAAVDVEQRVRELSIDGIVSAADGEVEISYEASFDDFDREVGIEPPPDDAVVALDDLPELRDQLDGGSPR